MDRRTPLVILALYVLLAVVLTWPLVADMGSRVPMGAHDLWQNYWNFWWWKTALFERYQSPYETDLIYYLLVEGQTPLGCHTHSPANILWTLPFSLLFGVPFALNLAVFSGFVFAGFGLYLLAREYAPGHWPAFIGGIIFAYFPQHVEQSLEHLNLASFYGIPFFLWALVRLVRGGGWRWSIGVGLLFGWCALLSWHNGLMAISLGIPLLVFEALGQKRPWRPMIAELCVAAVVGGLVVLPFLVPLFRDVASGAAEIRKQAVNKPVDLLFLLIPHDGHPFWGDGLSDLYLKLRRYPSVGFMAYLGIVTLALSCLAPLAGRFHDEAGQRPRRGTAWIWIGLALFFLLLSFGARLLIAGDETSIEMPFDWLKHIPLFGIVRVPNRFLVPAALAFAVLAAMGSGVLRTLVPARARPPVLLGIAILVVIDFLWLPYPMREVPRPAWLDDLARLPIELSVLDIPGGHNARGSRDMMLQTYHGRRIVGGYTSTRLRAVSEALETYPALRTVFQRYPPESALAGPSLASTVRELGVGVVIVHLDRTVLHLKALRETARREHPGDHYLSRIYNPETGIPAARLNLIRDQLREAFGEPVVSGDGVVEFYLVGGGG